MNPVIVIAAYNRPKSLRSILNSLLKANYSGFTDISLIISIDNSDIPEVTEEAEKFNWQFGTKKIIAHNKNLGLKSHILKCGDLTKEYGEIILLEDDLVVSPYFYHYTVAALGYYANDETIAGISLYRYQYNETAKRPFEPIDDGSDVFFIQIASSWGQAWNYQQWAGFRTWYDSPDCKIRINDLLPSNVLAWPESSWKKYFIIYMVEKDKYFVYPRVSLTTNLGDAGTHHKKHTNMYQVPILIGSKKFVLSNIDDSLAVYDVFFEILPEKLKLLNSILSNYDLEIDLYGTKNIGKVKKEYILTTKEVSSAIYVYKRSNKPAEMSVLLSDSDIGEVCLAKVDSVYEKKHWRNAYYDYNYYCEYFSVKELISVVLIKIINRLLETLRIKRKV